MKRGVGNRPQGKGWVKVASVTTGGKGFFWFRVTEKGREWWVWDRVKLEWVFESSDKKTWNTVSLS